MTQTTIFDPPAQLHSPTSRAAAESVAGDTNRLRLKVLAALCERPMTDEELMEATGLGGNCLRPRRRELQLAGKVQDSGETRPTKSGRQATVWKVK